jgi:hypothetical protein
VTSILLVSVALVAAIIGAGGLLLHEASQARACTWRKAAKAMGMTEVAEDRTLLGFAKGLSGRVGDMVSPLCKALDSPDTDVACAAARLLGLTGGEAAETALIAALEHDAPLVQRAAATALGRCGSAAAVKPLLAVDGPYQLRPAARQAIAEIQSRLTGATPGQLALADGDAGQLGLAEESPEGRVALADEAHGGETATGPPPRPPRRRGTE